jgi:hypothetical protein
LPRSNERSNFFIILQSESIGLATRVSADEVLNEVGLEAADSELRGMASTAEEAQMPGAEGVDAHVAVVEAAGLEEETSDLAETIIEIKHPALPVLETIFLNVETITVVDLVEANLFQRVVVM